MQLTWFALTLFSILPGPAEARREIRFPDLPGYRTLKCDFHMHTVYSDGLVWPTIRVDEAWREGLDAIALTDHIEYRPHKDDVPSNHNRPYEIALDRARQKNILVIRGAEITRDTPPGHHNALFLRDAVPLDQKDFYEVFRRAAAQRPFVFWCHPGWKGPEKGRWGEAQTRLLTDNMLHGIEVCNGDTYYEDAHKYALERNLTLLGNSDIHDPSLRTASSPGEHRTMTLVFARDRTVEAVREALDDRRTVVWHKNLLLGRPPHLAALFDATVRIRPAHHQARNTAWVEIENMCDVDIDLARTGKVGPAAILLPAGRTSLVKIDGAAEGPLTYRVQNFLVALRQPLEVSLVIPGLSAATTQPAAAGAR